MAVLRQGFRLHKRRRQNVSAPKRPAPFTAADTYMYTHPVIPELSTTLVDVIVLNFNVSS